MPCRKDSGTVTHIDFWKQNPKSVKSLDHHPARFLEPKSGLRFCFQRTRWIMVPQIWFPRFVSKFFGGAREQSANLKTNIREEIEKQFFGEVRCPFSEPDQKVLNAIDSKIKNEGEAAKNFIIEEIIKNPRILINKSHNPTIFKPGMWYNLAHLLCQVRFSPRFLSVQGNRLDDRSNLCGHFVLS